MTNTTTATSTLLKGDEYTYMLRMAQVLKANPVVALTCGFNAAGLLVSKLGMENNPIWVHQGESSTGMTLAAQTALSMNGNPVTLLKNMDSTHAIKSRMRGFNHTGACIDAIGAGNEKDKLAKVYQWATGRMQGRVQAKQYALSGRSYFTLLLTGAERFVDMQSANMGTKARVTQSRFDKKNPLWNSLQTSEAAEEWRGFIKANHGFLYPKLVAQIEANTGHQHAMYASIDRLLNGTATIQTYGHKSHTWIVALVGVFLLADVMHRYFHEVGGPTNVFTHDDVNVVIEHAKRLMALQDI